MHIAYKLKSILVYWLLPSNYDQPRAIKTLNHQLKIVHFVQFLTTFLLCQKYIWTEITDSPWGWHVLYARLNFQKLKFHDFFSEITVLTASEIQYSNEYIVIPISDADSTLTLRTLRILPDFDSFSLFGTLSRILKNFSTQTELLNSWNLLLPRIFDALLL